jgi:hypothetical protein
LKSFLDFRNSSSISIAGPNVISHEYVC